MLKLPLEDFDQVENIHINQGMLQFIALEICVLQLILKCVKT